MRVAVCFFGQSRTYDLCVPQILHDLQKVGVSNIDVFIHTWNENSYSYGDDSILETLNKETLFEELVKVCSPVDLEIQNPRDVGISHKNLFYGKTCQVYSLSRVLHLKRNYEISCGFTYDYVFLCRPDIYFLSGIGFKLDRPKLLDRMQLVGCIKVGTVQSLGYPVETGYQTCDMAFLMDSKTADIVAEYWAFWDWGRQLQGPGKIINNFNQPGTMMEKVFVRFAVSYCLTFSRDKELGLVLPVRLFCRDFERFKLGTEQAHKMVQYLSTQPCENYKKDKAKHMLKWQEICR